MLEPGAGLSSQHNPFHPPEHRATGHGGNEVMGKDETTLGRSLQPLGASLEDLHCVTAPGKEAFIKEREM